VLRLTALIMAGLFLLAEFVIPPTQQFAQGRRTAELSDAAPLRSGGSFWVQRDHQYLSVQRFEYDNVPSNIDIYAFSPTGALMRYIHADRANVRSDGSWLLTGVTRKTIISASQFRTEHLASMSWKSFLPPREAQLLVLPPDSMPPVALYRYVRDLERQGQQAARYEEELWAKISIPFAMTAMVMIVMPFVFISSRIQSAGQQIAIGAIIGMAFTLCQQIASRLDLLLNLNPAVTALSPPLLLMALAGWLFQRRHR
jgi:lipopolysaccharide export system permease protein